MKKSAVVMGNFQNDVFFGNTKQAIRHFKGFYYYYLFLNDKTKNSHPNVLFSTPKALFPLCETPKALFE
jgi:hypothetical protein